MQQENMRGNCNRRASNRGQEQNGQQTSQRVRCCGRILSEQEATEFSDNKQERRHSHRQNRQQCNSNEQGQKMGRRRGQSPRGKGRCMNNETIPENNTELAQQ